jgi:hypothetical protein
MSSASYVYIRIHSYDIDVLSEVSIHLHKYFYWVRMIMRHKHYLYVSLMNHEKEIGTPCFGGCCQLVQDFPSCYIICDDWHSEEYDTHGFYVVKWDSEKHSLETKSIEYIDSDYQWRGSFNQGKQVVKDLDPFLSPSEKQFVCHQLHVPIDHNGYYVFFGLTSQFPLRAIKEQLNLPEICYRDIRTFQNTIYLTVWMPGHPIPIGESLLKNESCTRVEIGWVCEDYSLEGKWVHSKNSGVDLEFESRLEFRTERNKGIDVTNIVEAMNLDTLQYLFQKIQESLAQIKETVQSFYSPRIH